MATATESPCFAGNALSSADAKLSSFDTNEQGLREHLFIQAPSDLDNTAPTLSFRRCRDIELPWDAIFQYITASSGSVSAIRDYFEKSWGVSSLDGEFERDTIGKHVISIGSEAYPSVHTVTFNDAPNKPKDDKGNPVANFTPIVAAEVVIDTGLALSDGYGRLYICSAVKGQVIGVDDFSSQDAYQNFWNEKLESIELAFNTPEEAKQFHTRAEYVDLSEQMILQAYDELKAMQDFDDTLQTELTASNSDMIKTSLANGINLEEINGIQSSTMAIRFRKHNIKRRMERLVQAAANLGYHLFLESEEITFPDGSTASVKPGYLYSKYKRQVRWTTTHTRPESKFRQGVRKVTSFFGIEKKDTTYKKKQSKQVFDYRKVEVNDQPLIDKIDSLGEQYQVFVFNETDKGYVSDDGVTVSEVMTRCEIDESFRRQCAVFLPSIEESLSGLRATVGYQVFIAPLPGMIPVAFPRLSFVESLSYRMTWTHAELGELAHSINLAPGESRSITVRRSFEHETIYRESRTSIFDLQEQESNDIASEMESQLRREDNTSWGLNLSQSKSASVGGRLAKGMTGSASSSTTGTFNYNKNLNKFSQNINKVAKKAAQSLNRQRRDEVNTASTRTTKISNYDEHTSTISNINEGRTLNLLFYRLNNQYQAGLYLDDLSFQVIPSTEIIAGSGIHQAINYDTNELDELLAEFSESRLPFDLDAADRYAYLRNVVTELGNILHREYSEQCTAPGEASAKVLSISVPESNTNTRMLMTGGDDEGALREQLVAAKAQAAADAAALEQQLLNTAKSNYEKKKALLTEILAGLSLNGRSIHNDVIQITAPGLYIDAAVGAVPSTEQYSEQMRAQMINMKSAEVEATRAEATYREALAARVLGENCDGGNWIVGVMPHRERNTLGVGLKMPLAVGNWALMVDGQKVMDIPADQQGNYVLNLSWDEPQPWLADDDLLQARLELHNSTEARIIRQLTSDVKPETT